MQDLNITQEIIEKTYQILDTIVKIGLGVLITGIFTYITNKKNHNHEINKIKLDKKIQIFQDAIYIVEEFIFSSSKLEDLWFKLKKVNIYYRDLKIENKNRYDEIDSEMQEKIRNLMNAISKFEILGLNDITEKLKDYANFIIYKSNDLKSSKIKLMSVEEFDDFKKIRITKQRDYYLCINNAYSEL